MRHSQYDLHQNLPYSTKQIGKKYGEHWDTEKEGYRNFKEYEKLANDIYNDPNSIMKVYPSDGGLYPGEIHYYNNNNILRLDAQGNFRSLYPIK